MSEGVVRLERRGTTAVVTFDRPEARNAMTWTMYQQLGAILDELTDDADVRAAAFRGAGEKAFIAGTDIRQFLEFEGLEDGIKYERFIEQIISRLETLPFPTLAAIDGYAVGGGLAIAAACDIRICTPDARFGMPIARTVGNCLSMENYTRLIALLGASRASAMLLTASMVPAEEAQRSGLVLDIVPRAELGERTESLLDTMASHAPITMRVTKTAIRRVLERMTPEGEDLVREAYGSSDFKEGVNAFLEKRKPEWTGS